MLDTTPVMTHGEMLKFIQDDPELAYKVARDQGIFTTDEAKQEANLVLVTNSLPLQRLLAEDLELGGDFLSPAAREASEDAVEADEMQAKYMRYGQIAVGALSLYALFKGGALAYRSRKNRNEAKPEENAPMTDEPLVRP